MGSLSSFSWWIVIIVVLAQISQARSEDRMITLEAKTVRVVIDSKGLVRSVLDKESSTEYADVKRPQAISQLVYQKKRYLPSSARKMDGDIVLNFNPPGVEARIKVAVKERYITLELTELHGVQPDEFMLARFAVTITDTVGSWINIARNPKFALGLLALNEKTDSRCSHRIRTIFYALCYPKFGMVGAKVALFGCPASQSLDVVEEIELNEGLPHLTIDGVWVKRSPELKKSYLFVNVTEANVDEVIKFAKDGGFGYVMIYSSTWSSSLGHYPINTRNYPNGEAGLKTTIDKLHAAGLKVGMHMLSAFIRKNDAYVRPVPDKRLSKDHSIKLADAIGVKDNFIATETSPSEFPTIGYYSIGHGMDLQIDDEIIRYKGISTEPPFGFTGCVRGANATKATEHAANSTIYHLSESYGAYMPDPDSSLLDEIAQRVADVYNNCGFDMIYFDGGEGIIAHDRKNYWHYMFKVHTKFLSRFKRDVLVQGSGGSHLSWHYFARGNCDDFAALGPKGYLDAHKITRVTRYYEPNFMQAELGWVGLYGHTLQWPATEPDDIEYLANKSIAYDCPIGLETNMTTLKSLGYVPDMFTVLKNYETLRLNHYFPTETLSRLKPAGAEHRLIKMGNGQWKFQPIHYGPVHYISALASQGGHPQSVLEINNMFSVQPLQFKLRCLPGAMPYGSESNVTIARFGENESFKISAARNVTGSISSSKEEVKVGAVSAKIVVSNSRNDTLSWCKFSFRLPKRLNLTQHRQLGLWVYGDGQNEVLNIQLEETPRHARDHYVIVDFKGWRYQRFVEPEGDRVFNYRWPYSIKDPVRSFNYGRVTTLNLYVNRVPAKGSITIYVSRIEALKENRGEIVNPSLSINEGKTITFHTTLKVDHTIVLRPNGSYKVRDPNGFVVEEIKLKGVVPTLAPGINRVRFSSDNWKENQCVAKFTPVVVGAAF